MKRTSFTATAEELKEIDDLRTKYGFSTRSDFLRVAALRFGRTGTDEGAVQQLAQAVFWLHKIQNAQCSELHLLKTSDVAATLQLINSAILAIREKH